MNNNQREPKSKYSKVLKELLLTAISMNRNKEQISNVNINFNERNILTRNLLRSLLDKVYHYINNNVEISPITKEKLPPKDSQDDFDINILRRYGIPSNLKDQKAVFLITNRLIIEYVNEI